MIDDDKKGKRRALGRGLSALLPAPEEARSFASIAVEKIVPAADQPRKRFSEFSLDELAASIREAGLIQPVVVREIEGHYELIAGERRWRASQRAGLTEIPAVIKELSDEKAFTFALVENVQREDLSVLEQASAYARLIEEYGYTQEGVAKSVGKSRSVVANALRLLKLPDIVKELLEQERITAGHARALAALDEEEAVELARVIVLHGYSVRETEEHVRRLGDTEAPEQEAASKEEREGSDGKEEEGERGSLREPEVREPEPRTRGPAKAGPLVEGNQAGVGERAWSAIDHETRRAIRLQGVREQLQEALGTRVEFEEGQEGSDRGRLVIHYQNAEILKELVGRILGESQGSSDSW